MRRTRVLVALVLVLVGLVWIGQGTGIVPGSAMSGSSFWAVVGSALVIGGVAIAVREAVRKPIA